MFGVAGLELLKQPKASKYHLAEATLRAGSVD